MLCIDEQNKQKCSIQEARKEMEKEIINSMMQIEATYNANISHLDNVPTKGLQGLNYGLSLHGIHSIGTLFASGCGFNKKLNAIDDAINWMGVGANTSKTDITMKKEEQQRRKDETHKIAFKSILDRKHESGALSSTLSTNFENVNDLNSEWKRTWHKELDHDNK